jgi:hypothetical protein
LTAGRVPAMKASGEMRNSLTWRFGSGHGLPVNGDGTLTAGKSASLRTDLPKRPRMTGKSPCA